MLTDVAIAVIGCGYVGSVVAAGMAHIGHNVVGVEIDQARLAGLQDGKLSFYEPGAEKLIREGIAAGRLSFTSSAAAAAGASIVFVCVDAPVAEDGGADLRYVEAAVDALAPHLRPGQVLVSKSTLPAGGAAWIDDRLARHGVTGCPVVVNPEFLREGAAVGDFLHPDRIVVGGDPGAAAVLRRAYAPILAQTFEGGRKDACPDYLVTDRVSAEVLKHAANAFLASRVSLINEIAEVCSAVGADVTAVAEAVGLDPRIGPAHLQAGLGWGGSCFGKDLDLFADLARRHGVEPTMISAIRSANHAHRAWVLDQLERNLLGLRGKRIGLLGLAFKRGTSDVRDSPAVDLAARLLAAGATVCAYDPEVGDGIDLPGLNHCTTMNAASWGADALVLATDWPEFVHADMEQLAVMMEGDLLVDLRNAWDPRRAAAAGLRHVGVGIPPSPEGDEGFARDAVGHA